MNNTTKTYNFKSWTDFWSAFDILGHRVHTLLCECNRAGGVSQWFDYTGDEMNGSGLMHVVFFSGSGTSYPFKVTDGKLKMFGRTQDMRLPTRMMLSNGRSDTYSHEKLLPSTIMCDCVGCGRKKSVPIALSVCNRYCKDCENP